MWIDELSQLTQDVVAKIKRLGEAFDMEHNNFKVWADEMQAFKIQNELRRSTILKPKGTPYRRCTKTQPVPGRPDLVRYLHYTKGWRYHRVVS